MFHNFQLVGDYEGLWAVKLCAHANGFAAAPRGRFALRLSAQLVRDEGFPQIGFGAGQAMRPAMCQPVNGWSTGWLNGKQEKRVAKIKQQSPPSLTGSAEMTAFSNGYLAAEPQMIRIEEMG